MPPPLSLAPRFGGLVLLLFYQTAEVGGATTLRRQGLNEDYTPMGWAIWSEWSRCSKACGRGVQFQVRRCMDQHCSGVARRHRICDVSVCPDSASAVNDAEVECRLQTDAATADEWIPIMTKNNCTLSCKRRGNGEFRHFAAISLKDGTKCVRSGVAEAACLAGKCLPVGCDGVIGSAAALDACGVCGGDGRNCARKTFRWASTEQFTPCDRTCGPQRVQMSVSVCVNAATDRVVPERLCADEPRPRPSIRSCPYVVCPAQPSHGLDYTWLPGDWSECSASCGGGHQTRDVFCVESHPSRHWNATPEAESSLTSLYNTSTATVWDDLENWKVADQYCWQLQKPVTQRECGRSECPYWQSGDWSSCSVSCGSGVRRRKVHCRQMGGNVAERLCLASARPIAEQICYTGVPCDQARLTNERVHSPFGSSWRRDVSSAEEDGDGGADALSSPSSAVYQYFRPSTTDGEENGPVGFDASMDSTKPRFLAGTWSECSASCGAGIRSRLVECVAIQGVTADTIKLPDYECDGQTKPTLFQPCQLRACLTDGTGFQLTNSLDEPDVERLVGAHTKQNVSELADTSNMKEFVGAPELAADSSAYRWEYDDWGACSAYCLGGKQKSLAKCVDAAHNRTVARTHCDVAGLQRPADLTRSCNQQACPPAWETSEFSECSHSCGGGIRTRRVRCTRTVARASSFVGAPSTLLLPEAQCPAPKPKEQQPCGIVDCEPEWKLSKWSQCSTSCGAGEQRRTAVCQQRDALGTVHIVQPTVDDNASAAATQQPRCGSVQRPPTIRLCDLGSCADFNLPIVDGPQFALPLRQNDVEQVPLVRHNHRPRDNSHGDADSAFDNDDGEDSADEAAERWNVENSFDQSHPKHRKLTLDVGGIANLYEGTSLKVKCPVRNFRRDAIHWTRNGNRIVNNAHTKVSTNGALRIFHARMEDAGFYECFAGSNDAVGNVTLHFKRHHDDTTAAEKGRKSKVKIGNRTSPKSQMNTEILQKVKENLYRAAEFRVLDALNTVSDPSRVGVEFHAGEWSACGADTPAADDECRAFARRPASSTKRPIQVRLLTCRLRVSHLVAKVDEEICESLGAARPPSTRPCTQAQPPTHCPRWTVGDWAACSESRCVVSGTAIQRRDVTCAYGNGTLVADATRCDRKARPKFKRECVNPNCVAEWRTSAWGKCSKTCGDGGVQMRLLRCVWHGTRKPAGRNCDATRRPIAVRMCDVASLQLSKCPSAGARLLDEDNNTSKFGGNSSTTKSGAGSESLTADGSACEDESRFCGILRLFQACDTAELRQKCCYSCHHHHYYNNNNFTLMRRL